MKQLMKDNWKIALLIVAGGLALMVFAAGCNTISGLAKDVSALSEGAKQQLTEN